MHSLYQPYMGMDTSSSAPQPCALSSTTTGATKLQLNNSLSLTRAQAGLGCAR